MSELAVCDHKNANCRIARPAPKVPFQKLSGFDVQPAFKVVFADVENHRTGSRSFPVI